MPFASSDDRLAAVKSATGSVRDPETGRPLLSVAQVQWEQQADAAHRLDVRIPRYSAPLLEHLRDQLQDAVNANAELSADSIEVVVGLVENERPVPRTGTAQVRIKSVIAVGSGKASPMSSNSDSNCGTTKVSSKHTESSATTTRIIG